MSKIDEYLEKYKALEASIQDVPPRPRVAALLYLGYCAVTGVIIWKSAHWGFFAAVTVIFLLIYYDVRQGCSQRSRDGPR